MNDDVQYLVRNKSGINKEKSILERKLVTSQRDKESLTELTSNLESLMNQNAGSKGPE